MPLPCTNKYLFLILSNHNSIQPDAEEFHWAFFTGTPKQLRTGKATRYHIKERVGFRRDDPPIPVPERPNHPYYTAVTEESKVRVDDSMIFLAMKVAMIKDDKILREIVCHETRLPSIPAGKCRFWAQRVFETLRGNGKAVELGRTTLFSHVVDLCAAHKENENKPLVKEGQLTVLDLMGD